MAKVYQLLILIISVICSVNANCKFKFKNNTATELEFGFKPLTNFKSINIKFPETPTSKLFECASKVDDSVTIEAKYKIGTNLIISELVYDRNYRGISSYANFITAIFQKSP